METSGQRSKVVFLILAVMTQFSKKSASVFSSFFGSVSCLRFFKTILSMHISLVPHEYWEPRLALLHAFKGCTRHSRVFLLVIRSQLRSDFLLQYFHFFWQAMEKRGLRMDPGNTQLLRDSVSIHSKISMGCSQMISATKERLGGGGGGWGR